MTKFWILKTNDSVKEDLIWINYINQNANKMILLSKYNVYLILFLMKLCYCKFSNLNEMI